MDMFHDPRLTGHQRRKVVPQAKVLSVVMFFESPQQRVTRIKRRAAFNPIYGTFDGIEGKLVRD